MILKRFGRFGSLACPNQKSDERQKESSWKRLGAETRPKGNPSEPKSNSRLRISTSMVVKDAIMKSS